MFGALTPLMWFFEGLALVALAVEGWALGDAVIRPAQAFVAVGKQTKPLWLIILGVATAVGLWTALVAGGMSAINILAIAAFVASAIYLTDVRPKVKEFRRGTSNSSGPYGPW